MKTIKNQQNIINYYWKLFDSEKDRNKRMIIIVALIYYLNALILENLK